MEREKARVGEREEEREREKESAISRSDFTWLLLIYYYEALLLPKNRKVSQSEKFAGDRSALSLGIVSSYIPRCLAYNHASTATVCSNGSVTRCAIPTTLLQTGFRESTPAVSATNRPSTSSSRFTVQFIIYILLSFFDRKIYSFIHEKREWIKSRTMFQQRLTSLSLSFSLEAKISGTILFRSKFKKNIYIRA